MVDGTGIFTNIDAFVKYLNEHGETDSAVLAQTMGVGERNIEEWAKILESSKMAKITYKLGRMFIAPVNSSSVGGAEEKQTEEVKKAVVGSEIDAQLRDTERILHRIDEFKKNISASESVIDENSATIKKTLDKIEGFRNEALKSYGEIKGKKEEIEKFSEEIGSMLDSLSGATELKKIDTTRKNAETLSEDIRKKIEAYQKNITDLAKTYDQNVKEQHKNLLELIKNTKQEIGLLKDMLNEENNELKRFDSTYKKYKQEAEKAKKTVENDKKELVDKASKSKLDLDNIFNETEQEWKSMDLILSKANSGISGFVEMQNKIGDIRKEIEDAEKSTNEIRAQIESLSQKIKMVGNTSNPETKSKIEKVDSEAIDTSHKIKAQEDKLAGIKKDIDELGGG